MSDLAARLQSVQQLVNAGKLDEARQALMRLLPKHGSQPAVNHALGAVLLMKGEGAQAAYYAQRAAAARPDDAAIQQQYAVALGVQGQTDKAIATLERLVAANPDAADARRLLARMLLAQDRLGEALGTAGAGLAIDPQDAELVMIAAGAHLQAGDSSRAVLMLEAAVSAHPNRQDLAGQLAFARNYLDDTEPALTLEAHKRFARRLARAMPLPKPPLANDRSPDRALRIGFISPDFNLHSVAFYIEPVLEKLDRGGFHVTCYDTLGRRDAVNERLRTLVDAWRDCKGLAAVDVARTILKDQIDVLVDLAGHTTHNCLAVLHLKPAPVIATYLGYPNTSGLDCVDWRIVDGVTDPAPEADAWATERLWRLDPCFLCYRPPPGAPDPSSAPCASGDSVTFGSFNHQQKLSEATVAAWSRVLLGTPGSRLVMKNAAMYSAEMRQRTLERFGAHGVTAERLELIDQVPDLASHLGLYGRIDIGLDPLAYNGTTTTCEALFMGVPVITMAGRVHAARVGASLLSCIGATELVAKDVEDYVRIASALAKDPARLAAYRSTLRQRVLGSALCDGPAFAARFGDALREMWRGWCGG